MGIISIRFNEYEDKILKNLENFYEEDKQKLLKRSLMEMYENLVDIK